MREIKFRAWNNITKVMVDLKKITPLALSTNVQVDGLFIPFTEAYDLMQYTGLKDKNGKEIYEGDIIKFRDEKYYVAWDHCQWALFWTMCNEHCMINNEEMEVIGNVFEYPTLLGEK